MMIVSLIKGGVNGTELLMFFFFFEDTITAISGLRFIDLLKLFSFVDFFPELFRTFSQSSRLFFIVAIEFKSNVVNNLSKSDY